MEQAAGSKTVNVKSTGGVALRTFAKNGAWNQSLYEDLAEPGIQSGMLLETWQNGSGGVCSRVCSFSSLALINNRFIPFCI